MSYDRLSKYLSLILRHHPEVIGISLDAHGWADVDELINGIARNKNFNREILEEIVRTDKKQRYSFNEDGSKIRANQGHSKSQPPLQVVVWVGPHKGRLHARPKGRVSQTLSLVRL